MKPRSVVELGIYIWYFNFLQQLDWASGECTSYEKCTKRHKYSNGDNWEGLTVHSSDKTKQGLVKEYECNNIPAKVELQSRPKSGPDQEFIFPGIPTSQRDDDVNSTYGGVVYYYTQSSGIVTVANRNTKDSVGFKAGKSIFTGSPHWSGPTSQSLDDCEARVRVWCQCDLPKPDYTSNWTATSNKTGENFFEFYHGVGREPELVTVVIDLEDHSYCDGIGSMTALANTQSTQYSWGGVIYGYNDTHVRVWAPSKNGGALFSARVGWSRDAHDRHYTGKVQVKVWSKVIGTHVRRINVNQNSRGGEIDLPVTMDVDNDLLFVTVKALDGANKGFSFPASGAVQNARDSGSYGGVVYSYSTKKLRYWLPPLKGASPNGPQGYLIYINDEYGEGHCGQRSLSAEIAIHVWKNNKTCSLPPGATLSPTTTTTMALPVTSKRQSTNPATGNRSNRSSDASSGGKAEPFSKTVVLILHITSGVVLLVLLVTVITLVVLRCKKYKENEVVPITERKVKITP